MADRKLESQRDPPSGAAPDRHSEVSVAESSAAETTEPRLDTGAGASDARVPTWVWAVLARWE